jgi:probable rRNA maturation factor
MALLDLQKVIDHQTPDTDDFQRWVDSVLSTRKPDAEITIRLVDFDESQSLNHQYRDKDKPTNVLSFPFELPEGLPPEAAEEFTLIGDLIICAPVVEQEADLQNKPLHHHWAHMVIHGTLHLLGYDHIEDEEAEVMEKLEKEILATLDIPDPYEIKD